MNDHTDIDHVLTSWFEDGPTAMPDRVSTAVADSIGRTRQDRTWRLRGRPFDMNASFKMVAALAAVVVIALVGYNLLPQRAGVGTPAPSAAPTVSPSPTATPVVMSSGALAPGTYTTRPFTTPYNLSLTFDVAGGWTGFPTDALIGAGGTLAPSGIGIAFLQADGVHSDPCHWDHLQNGREDQPGDVATGPSVDDLVNALAANGSYTTSTLTDTTLGGYSGRRLTVEIPTDLDLTKCDGGNAFLWGTPMGEYGIYIQGPGNRWDTRVLDVDGTRVIITVDDYAGTPAVDHAAAEAIVDSITFGS
jgi:hypothetical protein